MPKIDLLSPVILPKQPKKQTVELIQKFVDYAKEQTAKPIPKKFFKPGEAQLKPPLRRDVVCLGKDPICTPMIAH